MFLPFVTGNTANKQPATNGYVLESNSIKSILLDKRISKQRVRQKE